MSTDMSGRVWDGASEGNRHHATVGTFMELIQFMTWSRLRNRTFFNSLLLVAEQL